MNQKKDQWSSKIGFILSSAGAAIGLGAILEVSLRHRYEWWRCILSYFVIFTILIGLPLFISNYYRGRGSGKEAISAYKALAPNSLWAWVR